jgi:hypothetical protein
MGVPLLLLVPLAGCVGGGGLGTPRGATAAPAPVAMQVSRQKAIDALTMAFCNGEGWRPGTAERTACEAKTRTYLASVNVPTIPAPLALVDALVSRAHYRCVESGIPAPSSAFAACFHRALVNVTAEARQQMAAYAAANNGPGASHVPPGLH